MARARNIKPGLFKNEVLGVADPLYTLAFEGLWMLADKEGRLEDRPLRIKAEIFPYRDKVQIESILNWLHSNGFVQRYTVGGCRYILILAFKAHQNPHKNEIESVIPPPNSEPVPILSEPLGLIPSSLIPDSLSSDLLITSPSAQRTKSSPPGEELLPFNQHVWNHYPTRSRDGKALSKGHKLDALARCLAVKQKWGISWPELEATVKVYQKHPNVLQYNVQAVEVFFGERGHWLECWERVKQQQTQEALL